MRKFVFLAAVVAAAVSNVNCANSSEAANSLVAPSALYGADAKKPGRGNGETATLALVMVNDINGDGFANRGETVTFNVTSTATDPSVSLKCSQGGVVVYSSYSWPYVKDMILTSPSWQSGAADCTAEASTRNGVIGTLNFPAGE